MEAFPPHFTGLGTVQFCSFVTCTTHGIVLLYHRRYFPICELMYSTGIFGEQTVGVTIKKMDSKEGHVIY